MTERPSLQSHLRNSQPSVSLLSVSLKAENRPLIWRVDSLYLEVERLLYHRDRNSGWGACINKSCYFFILLLQAQTLFRFFTNEHPKPKFLVLSAPHKFIVSLSKKYKRCLLCYFLNTISMRPLSTGISFSPANLFCVNFMMSSAARTQEV